MFDKFREAFLARVAEVRVGDGLEPGVTMGPLNNERRLAAVEEFVEDARGKGAAVLAGGHRLGGPGLFYAPTVLADVSLDMDVMNGEPFGPIAVLSPFSELDDAIAEMKSSLVYAHYDLLTTVTSVSQGSASRLSMAVETGMLGVNHTAIAYAETPFGGVKDSGYGSDGGTEALAGYMQPKLVTVSVGQPG